MGAPTLDPQNLIAYTMQYHARIRTACELVNDLEMPLDIGATNDHDAVEAHAWAFATQVHPSVIKFAYKHTTPRVEDCRLLCNEYGHPELQPLTGLLLRNARQFERALELQNKLSPDTITFIEQITDATNIAGHAFSASLRLPLSVSGATLLRWDFEWTEARDALHQVFPEQSTAPAPSLIEKHQELEARVAQVEAQLKIAGGILSLPQPDGSTNQTDQVEWLRTRSAMAGYALNLKKEN